MNRILKKLFVSFLTRGEEKNSARYISSYKMAKKGRDLRIILRSQLVGAVLIIAGIFAASFGLKGFLLTNRFIDGGATGISLLITAISGIPLHYLIIGINIPFILLALTVVDRQFAIRSALGITGLALCLATVKFPNITDDNLLVAIFGGFFLGAGIGLAVRGGGVLDGTEVLAIYLSRKFGTTIGDIIVGINILVFSAAAYLLSVEIAMYSLITYLSASKTLDFIIEGIEEYLGVTIVSVHSDEIRQMIIQKLGRGVTVYSGKRGYGKRGESKNVDIIYTVITRLELNKLNVEVERIEPDAFIVTSPVKDTKGGMIKKRPHKK